MKYIYDGPYREFRGRVFANYNPVEIEDRGTLEAIQRDPTFKPYTERADEKPTRTEPAPNACPKCGKSFARGLVMHIRFCKGA